MKRNGNHEKAGTRSSSNGKNDSIIYIKAGQLCPNCGFAKLIKEPGNIIRCSVCGFGNGAGCT